MSKESFHEKLSEKLGEKLDEIRSDIIEMARDYIRKLKLSASIAEVQLYVSPDKQVSDGYTIQTEIILDFSDLDIEFNGSRGGILPKGGYTLTVQFPYQYEEMPCDHIDGMLKQEIERIKLQLKNAFNAVTFNPERDADNLPPAGTIIDRDLLVEFDGNYGAEDLGISGKVNSKLSIKHHFGENGKISVGIGENRLLKLGGKLNCTFNDLSISGGTTIENQVERNIQFEIDLSDSKGKTSVLKLLKQTVRFDEKGLPQRIHYHVADDSFNVLRTARIAKQLKTNVGGGYQLCGVGLSGCGRKDILSIYESRHTNANLRQADQNLATWIRAVEAGRLNERIKLLNELRQADGVNGGSFQVTARNEDAAELAAKFGNTYGTGYVCLEMIAKFGEQIKKCKTIKRKLELSKNGEFATLTYDALDSTKFITILMDLFIGAKVQSSLKDEISKYTDDIVEQVENSFKDGSWLENLGLKEKVGDKIYKLIKKNVEKIALSFQANREHCEAGRIILKASKIGRNALHNEIIAKMMEGDFADAVASGISLTTNVIQRESFKSDINFDFVGLLSYAMERSHEVIDEKTIWEYNGNKFQILEKSGAADKKVEGLNTTNFHVRTYYVKSIDQSGEPIPEVPTQAITTLVYTSKENQVALEMEAERLIGMATALKFDIFVPFKPERASGLGAKALRIFRGIKTLGGGEINIAAGTSTAGHVKALQRTPEEAEKIGQEVTRAILELGESPTPQLAAKAYEFGGKTEAERLEIANFINKYFWGFNYKFAVTGMNSRIDADEIKKIRKKIQRHIDAPPQRRIHSEDDASENEKIKTEAARIKAILPADGVKTLPDGFILAAGASAILSYALSHPDNELSIAPETYERTFHRKVKNEKFIRDMGQWARTIAKDPDVAILRAHLQKGEMPEDEAVLKLLCKFMEMADESTQGSTAIFSDVKDLHSLIRWTILHVMAGEENVIGMVSVDTKHGCFAAGSSPDLSPIEISGKLEALKSNIGEHKKRYEKKAHDC